MMSTSAHGGSGAAPPSAHGWASPFLLAFVLLVIGGQLAPLAGQPALAAEAAPELIVRLRDLDDARAGRGEAAAPDAARARLSRLVADLEASWRPAFPPAATAARRGPAVDLAAVQVLRFPTSAARDAAASRLAADPLVLYVEPVFEISAPERVQAGEPEPPAAAAGRGPAMSGGAPAPGDSLYPAQWALPLLGLPEVWQGGTGTPGILVAIVDTGIEAGHFDLAPNLAHNALEEAGATGVDDDDNGYVDDLLGWNVLEQNPDIEDGFGHGTHVAGIIGAASDGVRGTVGVTWEVGLLAVRMFNNAGRGTNLAGAQGIVYAAQRGAHVINLSWGTPRLSPLIREAVDYAAAAGAVLVASAGNSSSSVLDSFPAAFDPVIAVGATSMTDGLAVFSNRGPRIDLVAPGVNILSTQRGGHTTLSGTSQSAALVSGVVAHLLHRHPHLRGEEVRSILRLSAVDRDRPGWDPGFGAGRLAAAAALAQPSAPLAVILEPRTGTATAAAALEVLADAEAGSDVGGGTSYVLEMGRGSDPAELDVVAQGEGGAERHLGTLALAAQAEGEVTVRLRVGDASGREAEDRVLFRIDRTAPALLEREHADRLGGRRLEQTIRFACTERVTGRVRIREVGADRDFMDLVTDEAALDQVADLTGLASFFPGRYEYLIELRDLAGHTTRVDAGDDRLFVRDLLPIIDVPSDGFATVARFPGFELGAVADLDGDGRPELLGESRSAGKPGSQLTVLGAAAAWPRYDVRFQSGGPGLPLAARDLDGDGALEVLAGTDAALVLISGIAAGVPHTLWESDLGQRRGGGALVDSDGDGQGEILFSTAQGAQLRLLEWRGGAPAPIDLGFTAATSAAGFAIADYDLDGQVEIALGSLAGEMVVLEARGEGFVETAREPFLGRIANAIVATDVGDADGDGRREFAISAVGALLERQERPVLGVVEAAGDDRYEVSWHLGFRDKNIPYDNWLAAGDTDGDGRPELAAAQAGGVYLLDADRDDRFLPVWFTERAGGGRVLVADLDLDGAAEILISVREPGGPVTTIYSRRPPATLPFAWRAVVHPLGNEIRWEALGAGVRLFDLAIYRLDEPGPSSREGAGGPLESDLAERRIAELPGELLAAGSFRDTEAPPGRPLYAIACTVDDGKVRQRLLDRARLPAMSPEAPVVVVHPNPAAGEAIAISLALAEPAPVRVAIIDVAGRVRRELRTDPLPAGRHELAWDGRGAAGRRLASGVYFVRVRLPRGEHTSRLVLLR